MGPPLDPAGAYEPEEGVSPARRAALIAALAAAPAALRRLVGGLTAPQLDTKYRNWTARQIVHHLADSHANAYIRFKLALTEDHPTIKPYDEGRWAALPDALAGDTAAPLALLDGLHARWVQLLDTLDPESFARTFFHPEAGCSVRLDDALGQYAWHARHHTAQIAWLCEQHGWPREG